MNKTDKIRKRKTQKGIENFTSIQMKSNGKSNVTIKVEK